MSRRLLPSKLDTKPRRRRRNSTAERTRAQNAEDLKDNGEDGKSPSGAFTLLLSSKSSKVDQTAKSSTIQGTAKTEILHPNVPSTINETDRFDKENANFLSSIFPMEPSNQDQTQNAWGREDSCETFEKVNLSIVRPPQAYDSSDDIYSPRIPVPSLETFQMNTTENSRSRAISSLDKTYDDQNSSFDTVATKHTSKKEDPPSTSHASPPGSPRIDESLEPNINRTVGGSTDDDHVSKGTGSPATPSSRNTDLSQADPGLSTDKLSTEDDDDLSPIRPLSIPFQTNDTEKLSKRENNGDGPKETKTISHPDRNDSNGLSPNEVLSSLNVYSPSHASKIPSHPDDESTMLSLQPEDVLLYVTRDNSELLAENIQQQTQELDYKSDSEYSASTATQQYSPFHEKNNMLSPSFSGDEDHDSVFKSTGKQIRQRRDSFKDSGEDDDDDDLSWINRPVNSLQGITQQPYSRRRRSNGTIESIDTTDPLSPPSPKRKTNGLVDDEGASMTFAYTNSVEKEVENVIKDLFFIGSENLSKPGRQERKEEVVFSPTHETASVDTDGLSLSSASSSTSTAASLIRHEKESNNDPVVAILGGVSAALSDVLGITLEGDGEESDDYSESAASTIAFSSIRNAMNIGGVVNYATEKILRPAAAEAGDIMLGVHNASKKRRPQKKKKSRSLRRSKSDVVAIGRNNEFNEEYRSRHERVSRAVAASGDTNVEPNEIVTKKKYSKTKQVSRTVATAETNDMQAGQRRGELTRVNRNKEEIQTIKMAFSQGEKLEKVNKKILSETEYFSRIVASTETGNMRADPPHGDLVRVVKERREKTNTIKSTTLLDPIIAKSLGEWKIGESVRRGTEEEELNNSVLVISLWKMIRV